MNKIGVRGEMGKHVKPVAGRSGWALLLLSMSAAVEAAGVQNSQTGGSVGALLALACLAMLAVAFAILFYSVWHHRRTGHADAAHFHRSTAVEMAWTSVPVLILVLAAYPAAISSIGSGMDVAQNQTLGNVQRLAASDRAIESTGMEPFAAKTQ